MRHGAGVDDDIDPTGETGRSSAGCCATHTSDQGRERDIRESFGGEIRCGRWDWAHRDAHAITAGVVAGLTVRGSRRVVVKSRCSTTFAVVDEGSTVFVASSAGRRAIRRGCSPPDDE